MIEVATVSSKGQIVIPSRMREEIGLSQNDKLILVSDRDNILVKKVKEKEARDRIIRLLDKFSDKFSEEGITKEDIKKEIKALRKAK
ncbi:AbrB/MazE/SpoVT family DNA-binding domain-containing protein [Candidatus Woesearchaeota archaeon]|nr:AbrB/MazE/SpoVT family DNA-binding domain-containing protein [Candidatus Woesearchaeota archaeon]